MSFLDRNSPDGPEPRSNLGRATRIPYVLAAVALLGIFVLMLVNIISRNLGVQVRGVQGVSQILAVWIGFLLIGNLELEDGHLRVDFFAEQLPDTYQRYLEIVVLVVSLLGVVVLIFATYHSVQNFSGTRITAFDIPGSVMHAAPLLGSFILVVAYGKKLYDKVS